MLKFYAFYTIESIQLVLNTPQVRKGIYLQIIIYLGMIYLLLKLYCKAGNILGKWNWILLVINLLITLTVFLTGDAKDLFHLINAVFYVAFFYFVVTLILVVIKGRVLDGIVYSFRKFGKFTSRGLYDFDENGAPSEWVNRTFLSYIRFQTFVLIGILLILLAIYYLF